MYLTMALILAAASVWLEVTIVRNLPVMEKIYKYGIKFPIVGWHLKGGMISFAVSMVISVFVGGLFGMSGLTAGMAGIISSVVSEPTWMVVRKLDEKPELKQNVKKNLNEVNDGILKPIGRLLKFSGKAAWQVPRGAAWTGKKLSDLADQYQSRRAA